MRSFGEYIHKISYMTLMTFKSVDYRAATPYRLINMITTTFSVLMIPVNSDSENLIMLIVILRFIFFKILLIYS